MRGLSALVIAALVAGCGATPRTMTTTSPLPASVTREQVGAREVVVLPRPMGDQVAVTVWLDAGTLDAAHASAALAAAELVASSAGPEVSALVVPDGTRFSAICARPTLGPCVASLAQALGSRDVPEAAMERIRRSLEDRRVRGLASARREAETLAVSAALGIELAPLGETEELATDDVRQFLDRHYGSARSLWVFVGGVSASDVHRALDGAAEATSSASRAERDADDSAPRARSEERP
ncbi:MAG: hypothetical protein K1X94_35640, partial [Sandaracinaceae bacterium]|nr:hypothetical protein [Sandaracinaceae bacterium]